MGSGGRMIGVWIVREVVVEGGDAEKKRRSRRRGEVEEE